MRLRTRRSSRQSRDICARSSITTRRLSMRTSIRSAINWARSTRISRVSRRTSPRSRHSSSLCADACPAASSAAPAIPATRTIRATPVTVSPRRHSVTRFISPTPSSISLGNNDIRLGRDLLAALPALALVLTRVFSREFEERAEQSVFLDACGSRALHRGLDLAQPVENLDLTRQPAAAFLHVPTIVAVPRIPPLHVVAVQVVPSPRLLAPVLIEVPPGLVQLLAQDHVDAIPHAGFLEPIMPSLRAVEHQHHALEPADVHHVGEPL